MERDRSTVWFSIAGAALALAALALTQSGNVRETNPGAAARWVAAAWGLAGAGVAFVIVGLVTHFRRPKIKFQTAVEDKGDEAGLSLFRSDGGAIDGARCRITKWRRTVRECRPERKPIGSGRVTFAYPGDFESIVIDGVLDKGRHAVVWEARVRNRRTGLMERKRVARARFRITDDLRAAAQRLRERGTWLAGSDTRAGGARLSLTRRELPIRMVQCEVRRRHEDGSLGHAYVGHTDGAGAGEVALEFPGEFRREVGQTRRLMPGGGVQIDSQYEYPAGEPGDYEVLWKAVWFVTGGTFAADYEPTPDDFRREAEVAQHRFRITE